MMDIKNACFDFKYDEGCVFQMCLVKASYQDGNPALICMYYDQDMDWWDEYVVASVNLPESITLPGNTMFLDVNNAKGVIDTLVHLGVIELLDGVSARSGYCVYPAGKVQLENIPTKKEFDEAIARQTSFRAE